MGAQGWLEESKCQGWSKQASECVCMSVCVSGLRILSGTCYREFYLLFTISSPGTEFHCYVMDLSLLHTPRLSPVVGPGTDLGMCLQAGGKWAGQPSGWSMGGGQGRRCQRQKLALDLYKNPECASVPFS